MSEPKLEVVIALCTRQQCKLCHHYLCVVPPHHSLLLACRYILAKIFCEVLPLRVVSVCLYSLITWKVGVRVCWCAQIFHIVLTGNMGCRWPD